MKHGLSRPLLLLFAALMPALVGVSPGAAASAFNCRDIHVDTPRVQSGAIVSHGSATCILPSGFGNVNGILKLWAFERRDNHYHLIWQGTSHSNCTNAFGVALCSVSVGAQTGSFPPYGNYHAELEMIGGYTSRAPGLQILNDANSGGFCYHC